MAKLIYVASYGRRNQRHSNTVGFFFSRGIMAGTQGLEGHGTASLKLENVLNTTCNKNISFQFQIS